VLSYADRFDKLVLITTMRPWFLSQARELSVFDTSVMVITLSYNKLSNSTGLQYKTSRVTHAITFLHKILDYIPQQQSFSMPTHEREA